MPGRLRRILRLHGRRRSRTPPLLSPVSAPNPAHVHGTLLLQDINPTATTAPSSQDRSTSIAGTRSSPPCTTSDQLPCPSSCAQVNTTAPSLPSSTLPHTVAPQSLTSDSGGTPLTTGQSTEPNTSITLPSCNPVTGNGIEGSSGGASTLRFPDTAATAVSTNVWLNALRSLPRKHQELLQNLNPVSAADFHGTFEDILRAVSGMRDRVESSRWTLDCFGKRVSIRSEADAVVRWLNRFKQAGDVAVNADPLHAGLAWAAIRLILQAAVSGQEQMERVVTGLERVTYILNRCRVYADICSQTAIPTQAVARSNLENALSHLYRTVLRFLAGALEVLGKTPTGRALQAFWRPEEIQKFVEDCKEGEDLVEKEVHNFERVLSSEERSRNLEERVLSRAARLDTARQLQELIDELKQLQDMRSDDPIRTQIDTMWRYQTVKRMSTILQWVSAVPYLDHHRDAAEGRTPGTGTWLCDHSTMKTWEHSASPMILWLHGIPGAGKTKLITYIVDRFAQQSSEQRIAYFYCNYNEKRRGLADEILRSFVKQLAVHHSEKHIHESVCTLYEKKESLGFASKELSYTEAEALIHELIPAVSKVTFIIDALDECPEKERKKVIAFFNRIVERFSDDQVKILISSRRNSDIKRQLLKAANVGIEADLNQGDISLFVMEQILTDRKRREDQNMPLITEALATKIVQVFAEKSGGMFQWAALHISQLLDLELESDIHVQLGRLPEGLKEAYAAIIDTIRRQNGSKSQVGIRALQWIQSSGGRIPADVLVQAVCQDPTTDCINVVDMELEYVIGACQNLVVVDAQRNCCFSHFSVWEYLITQSPWPEESVRCLTQHVYLRSLIWEHPTEALAPALREYADHAWLSTCTLADERTLALVTLFLEGPDSPSPHYFRWYRRMKGRLHSELFPCLAPLVGLSLVCFFGWTAILRKWHQEYQLPVNKKHEAGFSPMELAFIGSAYNSMRISYRDKVFSISVGPDDETIRFLLDNYSEIEEDRLFRIALESSMHKNKHKLLLLLLARTRSPNSEVALPFDFPREPLMESTRGIYRMEVFSANALIEASYYGKIETVQLLIDNGADIRAQACLRRDKSPFHLETSTLNAVTTELAESRPRKVFEAAALGGPRHEWSTSNYEVMQFLLARGAEVDTSSGEPLAVAALLGDIRRAKFLIGLGFDVNQKMCRRYSNFDSAIAAAIADSECALDALFWEQGVKEGLLEGRSKIFVRYLLKNGADPDTPIEKYGSILVWAAYNCYVSVIQDLLERGCDINKRSPRFQNALLAAARSPSSRYRKAFAILLQAGADPDAGGDSGSGVNVLTFELKHRSDLLDTLLGRNQSGQSLLSLPASP